jgi:hypothetical protein
MDDGVVPGGNSSDDPKTWSPMIEIEEAVENEVVGSNLMLVHAGRDNMQLDVEERSDPPSTFEIGEGSTRLYSVVVVPVSDQRVQPNVLNFVSVQNGAFRALFVFLHDAIYKQTLCLTHVMGDQVDAPQLLVFVENELSPVFSVQLRDKVFLATLLKLLSPVSLLGRAELFAIKSLLHPVKCSWADTFKFMSLSDEGELIWEPVDLSLESDMTADSCSQLVSFSENGASSAAETATRRRGRPRKSQEAPKVKSSVRYCTRNNNEGYRHQVLADTRGLRRASKAIPPAVLQISEMQKIGVEDCQINPEELTVERLMQGRQE